MSLQISKGINKSAAVRGLFYGVEGIGKSTFATKIPHALVADVEDGTGQIDCERVVTPDFRSVENVVTELIKDSGTYKALIIDTADWLEKAMIQHMLDRENKQSIEDYGYGKGYTIIAERMTKFLATLDKLIAKGISVIFVAHAIVKRMSPPDQTDGYDRYEVKLSKQVGPLLKEWADLIIFCNYKVQIVKGTDGRLKAEGGTERMMFSTHSAAWDAKNRFGLPNEMPMEFGQIAHLFGSATPRLTAPASAPLAPVPETPKVLASAKQQARIKELVVKGNPEHTAALEAAFDTAGALGTDELTPGEADALIAVLESKKPGATPTGDTPSPVPANIAAWLDANAKDVNAYLERVKWIKTGQTWRNLAEDKLTLAATKPEKFARAAAIPALT